MKRKRMIKPTGFVPDDTGGCITKKEAKIRFGLTAKALEHAADTHDWVIRHGKGKIVYYDLDDVMDLHEGLLKPRRPCLGCDKPSMRGRYYCTRCEQKRKKGEILRPAAQVAIPGVMEGVQV